MEDAVQKQGSELIQAILSSSSADFPKIASLIQAGAPLWFQEDDGLSALHAACLVENPQIVKELIEKGAMWNCVDSLGNTAADISLSLNDEESYRIIRDEGLRSEYLLQVLSSKSETPIGVFRHIDSGPFGSTEAFLNSRLNFSETDHGQEICSIVSGDTTVGVMMGWERKIMQATVEGLCSGHPRRPSGLRVLNIGFGLGIVDTLFQSLDPPPSQHTIIEPHTDVLAYMRSKGWHEKCGVKVLEGRWQDFVFTGEIFGQEGWDVVYIDTFAEGYEELTRFFDIVPDLVQGPEARFSFFNGLGATGGYSIAELYLKNVGLVVHWSDVDTEDHDAGERWGDTKEYFKVRFYRLPIGQMTRL